MRGRIFGVDPYLEMETSIGRAVSNSELTQARCEVDFGAWIFKDQKAIYLSARNNICKRISKL